jgi:soluble lytic murein transglycosylase
MTVGRAAVKRALALAIVVGLAAVTLATLQSTKPGWWERLWYPLRYEQVIRGHARHYDLDPALLAAVIYQESKFHPSARSRSGAIGLMQLLPQTAEGIAVHTGGTAFRTSDLYDPEINVRYGAWYLHHLEQKYGDERTALAAYNAGQENIDRWRAEGRGIAFAETRAYVSRVEELRHIYRRAYAKELGY